MAVHQNPVHLSATVAASQIRTPFCCWLQGYQSFTQALWVLELKEARDAFLLLVWIARSKCLSGADCRGTSPSHRPWGYWS